MTEADFVALNKHLEEVRPIVNDFCRENAFAFVNRRSVGRYPRIRVERSGLIKLWFDLWMELDENGKRFQQFKRDIPYELSAGAYIDVNDRSKYGTRFQKSLLCFSGKRFDEVAQLLRPEMERYLRIMQEWDVQYLTEHGKKVQLGF